MTDKNSPLMALRQFQTARKYTLSLIEGLTPDQWFWTPQPPVSHVAWQIGHVAVAQYGLMLFRQRGRSSEDADLMAGVSEIVHEGIKSTERPQSLSATRRNTRGAPTDQRPSGSRVCRL
jgi:hypothetical protein